jgi:hypothetical protein
LEVVKLDVFQEALIEHGPGQLRACQRCALHRDTRESSPSTIGSRQVAVDQKDPVHFNPSEVGTSKVRAPEVP